MAKRHVNNDIDGADIDITPMLDIVFIMLIFFIVTTSFVKESGISVNRPSAETAEQKTGSNLLVAIRANGEIWIDRRVVDVRSVRANIERMKADNPEGAAIIQADEFAPSGLLVKVMDQIRLAGITNISIAAREAP
ncbi:MAG: biopolymer transporter ExbD [Thalassolituus sp.]|jgi:biopolymer transport protein ExbD|uniref:Biopolymer transport exbD2 protein n=2 Tax=root TaxID=1 RepID=M5DQA2_9GAMM|nr:biopolymer transporter ExbD [Thalassolituus oleivorans]PCI48527.1 MAG: biopolymer transporter ExbD [Oceanospirillales bacterium]AHK15917.1 biopolymer transporter ExbD [Thalassolituus oleivorans R6-15]APR67207.1 biopolymer transporter ExbD [Thalassolituus oleivorans]MBQ0728209.1 biopolymer transporter ExbD [Thalassolituus oleivorans]MBQ0779361.1 biopolymer transporter ExbD [Thalassolituus oleivorans]|tara:strand:- start:166 stop:573 length:408 start_codon:yes stop_codon:yes gene_type:complete